MSNSHSRTHRFLVAAAAVCALVLGAMQFAAPLAAAPKPTRLSPKAEDAAKSMQATSRSAKSPSGEKGKETQDERATPVEVFELPADKMNDGPPLKAPGYVLPSTEAGIGTLPMEVEPNGTAATATPMPSGNSRIQGNVFPNADVDFFSFSATAGDRVYAAVQTSFSANNSTDSQLRLFSTDGTTLIEFDDDDGSLGSLSSSIAGAVIPATGTFFLEVRHFSATNQLRPYYLHLRVQTGTGTAETEPNDTTAAAQPLPMSGHISGSRASGTDVDFYSMTLNAGDTVFLSLDNDPERNAVTWNGRLGFGLFGTAMNQILVVNDASVTSPNSEALFMTVKNAGTYFAYVDAADATFNTYQLNVNVYPRVVQGTCTTVTNGTSTPIATGPGVTTSTIIIPGSPRVSKLRVSLNLNHANMPDLDVELTSPAGNTVGLFSDIGSNTQTLMDLTLDDDAGLPIGSFTVVAGPEFQPELAYRLGWFNGVNAGGTWTLTIRDDTAANGGTLNSWSIEVCDNFMPLTCGADTPSALFSTDFESGDAGFTHSGAQDEWERGLPTFVPITTANSGVNCWKTDLDNGYNASSSQDLFSPNIVIPVTSGVQLRWAMLYQIENTSFDRAFVEVREVGGGGAISRVWEWYDATMTNAVGNPTVTVQESAGWGLYEADITAFAGKTIQVVFHLDSDTTVQLAGMAIDDVSVTICPVADLQVTSFTDAPDPVNAGSNVTYTINVTNNGPSPAQFAAVTLPLPASTTFVSSTAPMGWSTTAPSVGTNGTVGFTKTSVASGESATFTVTAATGCASPIDATASITSMTSDPVMGNNSLMTSTTVNDVTPPAITCPANITVSNTPGQCSGVATFTATATDNCTMPVTPVCVPASGSTFSVGATTVTCTATDAATNMASCSFTVTVNDTEAPVLTCPANITMNAGMGSCTAVVNYTNATATDNCPGVVTVVCVPASGATFNAGVTTVTCTGTDGASNMGSCSFTVTVVDMTPPTITCPTNITVTGTTLSGCTVSQVVTYPAPTATDNCTAMPTVVCVPASGAVFNEGVTTVTCTASDGGNTATCSFTVTVGAPFGFCAVGDGTGDTFQIVVDPMQQSLFGYWRYHIAATNTTICGIANSVNYVEGIRLRAYDNNFSTENPTYFMDANFTGVGGTVYVKRKNGTIVAILRDASLANDPPCN